MTELRIRLLHQGAIVPRYATEGAAGLDLSACLDAPLEIAPGEFAKVPTGIAVELPIGTEGQVRPRSGLAVRLGVTVLNAPGTIDEDFRGELQVILVNHGKSVFRVESGDRIAQLVVVPVLRVAVSVVDTLGDTARGLAGFGSTGVGSPGEPRR